MCSLGVAGVAAFAIAYNVPRYLESTLVWNGTANVGHFARTRLGSSPVYTRVYMDYMYYVVSFVAPLLLLGLFNAKLILAYRRFREKRRILRPTQLNARFVKLELVKNPYPSRTNRTRVLMFCREPNRTRKKRMCKNPKRT